MLQRRAPTDPRHRHDDFTMFRASLSKATLPNHYRTKKQKRRQGESGRVVHIAGGEAMLYWDRLVEALQLAGEQDVAPHFIETNCSFAVRDELVRDRFSFMARHGVRGLYASADPYHQEFVPADRFLRVRRLAREIFGEQNFYGPAISDEEVHEFGRIVRDEARLREYVRRHPPAMVGTAQRLLARHLDALRPDDPGVVPVRGWGGPADDYTCASQFLRQYHPDVFGPAEIYGLEAGMTVGFAPPGATCS